MALIQMISGLMKGGKSKILIDDINKAHYNGFKYAALKPASDTRDGLFIRSRARASIIPAQDVYTTNLADLLDKDVIFIDEAHFISLEKVKQIVRFGRANDINVIFAGLLYDFRGYEFESSAYLMEEADLFGFLKGVCDDCGAEAAHDIRLVDGQITFEGATIVPEGEVEYKTVCESCYMDRRSV
jgi:thymidine kinase